ncbi:MAG: restriction endonuclease subunit S [Bacteroidetes bacterium]|nr:restriction endonuclease subunit S [Bacteroidota bacterium]
MKEGYKDTPIGMIPEDWDVVKLADILIEGRLGGNYNNGETESGLPLMKMGNIGRGKIDLKKVEFIPINEKYQNNYILKEGDLLFNTRNTLELVGKVAIWKNELDEALYNSNLMKMTFDERRVASNYFMNFVFNSKYCIEQLRNIATGTTSVAAIYTKDLLKLRIAIPTLPEQSKIASILSTVDDKIDAINERIIQTRQLKNGLMQRLLTRGIGHTKFKDSPLGEIPESWEIHKLSDIAIVNDQSLSNDTDPEYSFYYIDLASVKVGKIDFPRTKIQFKTAPSRARRILKNGDVMATVRPNLLGYAIANFETNEIICSTGFAIITPLQKAIGYFIYQSLYYELLQCQIQSLLVGSNYPAINSTDVENLRILLPPYPEQQKISEILFSVDQKLEVLQKKKTKYEEMKKGLMQQLLTGKVRVKVDLTL